LRLGEIAALQHGGRRRAQPHQTGVGVVESVVQGEPLHQLKQGGVVKAAGVGRNEVIHAMLLRPVCVCVVITSSRQEHNKRSTQLRDRERTLREDSKRGHSERTVREHTKRGQ